MITIEEVSWPRCDNRTNDLDKWLLQDDINNNLAYDFNGYNDDYNHCQQFTIDLLTSQRDMIEKDHALWNITQNHSQVRGTRHLYQFDHAFDRIVSVEVSGGSPLV